MSNVPDTDHLQVFKSHGIAGVLGCMLDVYSKGGMVDSRHADGPSACQFAMFGPLLKLSSRCCIVIFICFQLFDGSQECPGKDRGMS